MPYKDREKKLARMREWRQDVMPRGYGKWLYARRKLRFDDAERFRAALEKIADRSHPDMTREEAAIIASLALEESKVAEEALGEWEGKAAKNPE